MNRRREAGRRVLCLVVGCALLMGCSGRKMDAITGATTVTSNPTHMEADRGSDVLIILVSSENGATEKITRRIAGVLGARVVSPEQVTTEEIQGCSLIGFGSGIFDQRHHAALFALAERLPELSGKAAFLFSTSGVSRQTCLDHGLEDAHTPLREKLRSKGFLVVGEFNCAGFNNNSFLKLFGGMNRGRPNANDLEKAEIFARELKEELPAKL